MIWNRSSGSRGFIAYVRWNWSGSQSIVTTWQMIDPDDPISEASILGPPVTLTVMGTYVKTILMLNDGKCALQNALHLADLELPCEEEPARDKLRPCIIPAATEEVEDVNDIKWARV
ncbi:hypothetical protein K439DRAFT_1612096 [Ramaria rubella]|nr:hypothetical protein K439DRAFT_1612096 [Ramaria rubella]